jgi:hypothetical protein
MPQLTGVSAFDLRRWQEDIRASLYPFSFSVSFWVISRALCWPLK